MATQWLTVGVCGTDGYMLMQKCLFQGKEFIYITEVHPRCELFGVWLCKESLGAKYITFFFLFCFFSKVGQWPVLMMILKAGLLVVEGGLWVGITERFLNVFFWGQVSHPLYFPSTSRLTGTLSFRCALKRSRFKLEQGYPTKVGLSLLIDTNDTFHCCASCWDAVCLCVVTVAVFQVVMSVFHYFYILESEACSSFHIRRSAIGVWETSVLYPQGPVLRMWVTKLSLNVNSLKWARISFFPLSSPQFSHGSLSSNPEKKHPAFLKWVGFKLLEKVAPFKVKNTLQQNETTAVKYGL